MPHDHPARAALADVRVELTRADQKAAMLLALVAAVAAGAVAAFAARPSGLFALWNGVEWLAWSGLACLTGSLFLLLACVRPDGANSPQGTDYFAFYARYSGRPDDLRAHFAGLSPGHDGCAQLIELSVLAGRKYRLIARAVTFLGAALPLLASSVLLDAMH
ncbi:Pycsar system effector family protein [Streptomyces sp. NPDC055815]